MRSHRIQKTAFRDPATTSYSISEDFVFSKFEKYEISFQGDEGNKTFTKLPVYTKPADSATNTTTDEYLIYGKKAVEDFSEELKYQRRAHLKKTENNKPKASKFQVDLGYSSKEANDTTTYQCVSIIFSYNVIGSTGNETLEEKITIQFVEIGGKKLQIDELDLDSDVTEYLFRFTRGLEWGSETHGILDCNPNESINKGVYFTLNAPFNENIDWSSTSDKRNPIYAYRIFDIQE